MAAPTWPADASPRQAAASTRSPMTRAEALQRLRIIASGLGLDFLLSGLLLRVTDAVPTARWVYNVTRGTVEIHVHPRLCEELPDDELAALLFHELYHHVGFSELYHLHGLPSPVACNIAFDIALERIIDAGSHGPALRALNDRLRSGSASAQGPLSRAESVTLLIHSRPPLERMPADIQEVWRYLWRKDAFPSPEICYQHVLPLVGRGGDEREVALMLRRSPGGAPQTIEIEDEATRSREILLERGFPESAPCRPIALPPATRKALARALPPAVSSGGSTWLRALNVPARERRTGKEALLREWLLRQRVPAGAARSERVVAGGLEEIVRRAYLVRPTRSELLNELLGWPRILYANRSYSLWRPLAVYLDVSSSMSDFLPDVVAVLRCVRGLLPAALWAFDTAVKPLGREEALQGNIFQGAATSFTAVFEHALSERSADLLVLTDGMSEVSDETMARAAAARLRARAVLFGPSASDAEKHAWWRATFVWPA